MKTKKIIALLMVLVMLSGVFTTCVWADDSAITVYLTVSNQGILGQALDGSIMAKKAVEVFDLDESGTFTVSEALIAAHSAYNTENGYDDGAGYATKLWGIESTNILFFVNDKGIPNGVRVDTIEDGDVLVASINKDNATYSDWYTYFDIAETTVEVNEEFILNLNGFLGMTYPPETATAVALPDISASLWKDGMVERIEDKVTDKNGQVALSFDEPGVYYVTADGSVSSTVTDYSLMNMSTEGAPAYGIMDYTTYETQMAYTEEDYGEGPYPAEEVLYIDFNIWKEHQESYHTLKSNQLIKECPIIPPVCEVTVKEEAEIQIIHNIAEKYLQSDLSNDVSMQWFIAELETYKRLYPETDNILSEEKIRTYLNEIIDDAKTTSSVSNLAKDIIALRALGYDAKKLYTKDGEKIDAVARLTKFIDDRDSSITGEYSEYALPYIIIALNQGENYASTEQMDFLLDLVVRKKAVWQDTSWGTDAAAPMILALAPYYNSNDDIKTSVEAVIDEAIDIIKAKQETDGSMSNAASTGLVIAGLSSMGIDPETVVKEENNLIDGLMLYATEDKNGFLPADSTIPSEQGFRGLLGWQLLQNEKGIHIFDFKDKPMNEAKATISEDDDYIGDGGEYTGDTINVNIKVMVHEEDECKNSYTYREDKKKYTSLAGNEIILPEESTVYDALIKLLEDNEIEFEEKNNGYISSIDSYEEFGHGSKSGWMFTINGEVSSKGCKSIKLKSGDKIVWFYTDNYYDEDDAPKRGVSSSGGKGSSSTKKGEITEENPEEKTDKDKLKDVMHYSDVKSEDWYYESVKYVTEEGLMNGTDNGFEPEKMMTREMLVTVIYRMSGEPEPSTAVCKFEDVEEGTWYSDAIKWAGENDIVCGVSDTEFGVEQNITREQMAVMFMRYAKAMGCDTTIFAELTEFTDHTQISKWAVDSFKWAMATGLICGTDAQTLAPADLATRAEVATIITRFCEKIRG